MQNISGAKKQKREMKASPSMEILNFSIGDKKQPNIICLYFVTRFDEKCPDFVTNQTLSEL